MFDPEILGFKLEKNDVFIFRKKNTHQVYTLHYEQDFYIGRSVIVGFVIEEKDNHCFTIGQIREWMGSAFYTEESKTIFIAYSDTTHDVAAKIITYGEESGIPVPESITRMYKINNLLNDKS